MAPNIEDFMDHIGNAGNETSKKKHASHFLLLQLAWPENVSQEARTEYASKLNMALFHTYSFKDKTCSEFEETLRVQWRALETDQPTGPTTLHAYYTKSIYNDDYVKAVSTRVVQAALEAAKVHAEDGTVPNLAFSIVTKNMARVPPMIPTRLLVRPVQKKAKHKRPLTRAVRRNFSFLKL